MGVDGLRLDATPYLYEAEGTTGENLPETHAILRAHDQDCPIQATGTSNAPGMPGGPPP